MFPNHIVNCRGFFRGGTWAQARLFHLFSKARARSKQDLFSKFFEPEKAQARSMKPKPKKVRPDPPLVFFMVFSD
jgi:hypothetical protein